MSIKLYIWYSLSSHLLFIKLKIYKMISFIKYQNSKQFTFKQRLPKKERVICFPKWVWAPARNPLIRLKPPPTVFATHWELSDVFWIVVNNLIRQKMNACSVKAIIFISMPSPQHSVWHPVGITQIFAEWSNEREFHSTRHGDRNCKENNSCQSSLKKTKQKKGGKSSHWASATPISINNQGSILLEWKFVREKVDCFLRASVMLIGSLDSIVALMIHW